MNQLKVVPLIEVGNIQHHSVSSVVCKPTWVRCAFTCSFGSVVPSYLSNVGLFQVSGKGTSRMVLAKGFLQGVVPNALVEAGLIFSWYELSTSCIFVFALSPRGISSTASRIFGFSASFCFIGAFSFLKVFISSSLLRFIPLISSLLFFFNNSISFCIFKINAIGSGWLVSSCAFLSLHIMFLVVTMWIFRGVFFWPHGGRQNLPARPKPCKTLPLVVIFSSFRSFG